jgi:hypothetical protein
MTTGSSRWRWPQTGRGREGGPNPKADNPLDAIKHLAGNIKAG